MKKVLLLALPLAFLVALLWPGGQSASQTVDPVLLGVGDIADGDALNLSGAMATAALLDSLPGATVFTAGDLVYPNGTDGDFTKAYDPTWGRARARTFFPVPGNHEYNALNAAGYFNYFGPAAGDPTKGYYSLNLGSWHIVVLNTNLACSLISCSASSPQGIWLTNDLAANTQPCTLALWHHPLYTSTTSPGPTTAVRPLYQILYNYNADLVVNGHAHLYERFAAQDANGNLDVARGIIEIVAGMGGVSHHSFGTTAPNSLVRNSDTYGVLQLTLHASSFDWQFIPVAGQTFTDSGTQPCH